jgi:hypothetical protein
MSVLLMLRYIRRDKLWSLIVFLVHPLVEESPASAPVPAEVPMGEGNQVDSVVKSYINN